MSDKKFNYIIYHRSCLDGFSGFFVAYTSGRLTKDVIIYPDVPSAKMVPPDIDGKDVIIIDVAYRKEVLEEIIKHANSVVFIDHHVSIADDVQKLKEKYQDASPDKIKIVYDEERSGATLAWKFFNSRQTAPLFLKYVEDQDTGRWEHENTKPFVLAVKANYHLSPEDKSINKWFRLMNKENVLELVEEGQIMLKYSKQLVSTNVPRHTMHRFPSTKLYNHLNGKDEENPFDKVAQYKIALFCGFNCPSVTDLAVGAFERIDCDFMIAWVYNLDRQEYVFSMRSKEVDISNIAKSMGGGGHKLAAAMSFYKKDFDIDDMFEGNALPRNIKPSPGSGAGSHDMSRPDPMPLN